MLKLAAHPGGRCIAAGTRFALCALLFAAFFVRPGHTQESPYIVTYSHYLEEPGNLEVECFSTLGTQRGGNDFHAFWVELPEQQRWQIVSYLKSLD